MTGYYQYFKSHHKITGVLSQILEKESNQLSSVEGFVMSDHRITLIRASRPYVIWLWLTSPDLFRPTLDHLLKVIGIRNRERK